MRLLALLLLAACDPDPATSADLAVSMDLAIIGTCPSATSCDVDDECVYPGFEPTTCICVAPELVSCCSGGAGAICSTAVAGAVCCGFIRGGQCANGCECVDNHWRCPDGGA